MLKISNLSSDKHALNVWQSMGLEIRTGLNLIRLSFITRYSYIYFLFSYNANDPDIEFSQIFSGPFESLSQIKNLPICFV